MFEVLAADAGRVVSREEISKRAGLDGLSPRRCDTLIAGLRRRLGHDRVRTVRKRGWMLVV